MGDQAAAIPYRRDANGLVHVLLVTSKRSRRWILPKGRIKPGSAAHESAAREAFEEAGVTGRISPDAVGMYRQRKFLAGNVETQIRVHAFPLDVGEEMPAWPEMDTRARRWFAVADAVEAVQDEAIGAILQAFAARIAAAPAAG